jgi:hypothetical protein
MLAIGEKYRQRLGISLQSQEILWLPDNTEIDQRLAGHADLSLFLPGNKDYISAPSVYPYIANILTNKGLIGHTACSQGPSYPDDVGLCLCCTGRYTIYNPDTIDSTAKQLITGAQVLVTQGYTKCTVSVVGPDSIITADCGIASKAALAGMNVLQITPGHIVLDGFDYGFIGGASFLLDAHTMAFTGTLDGHPDKNKILRFLADHGVRPVFLTREPIFDIGGAIILP